MKQSFLATKSMNHIRPEQHFHFPKSPPTSSLLYEHQNCRTTSCFTRSIAPDDIKQTAMHLWIQFQAPDTTDPVPSSVHYKNHKNQNHSGHEGGRPVSPRHQPHKTARTVSGIQPIVNRKQKRSQLSLPGRIGSSLRREGTPLNPRSGELGSRQVGWRTGRPAARGYSIICQD